MAEIKCIVLLTSGGYAQGMNQAIRAVTRSSIISGFKVKRIYQKVGDNFLIAISDSQVDVQVLVVIGSTQQNTESPDRLPGTRGSDY